MQIPQEILSAGALRFGASGDDIHFLGGGGPGAGGVVYRFSKDGAEWTLKFMPGSDEAARNNNEKLSFVRYLAGRGVNVACPQPSINGHITEVVTSGPDSYIISSENLVPGHHTNTRSPAE